MSLRIVRPWLTLRARVWSVLWHRMAEATSDVGHLGVRLKTTFPRPLWIARATSWLTQCMESCLRRTSAHTRPSLPVMARLTEKQRTSKISPALPMTNIVKLPNSKSNVSMPIKNSRYAALWTHQFHCPSRDNRQRRKSSSGGKTKGWRKSFLSACWSCPMEWVCIRRARPDQNSMLNPSANCTELQVSTTSLYYHSYSELWSWVT